MSILLEKLPEYVLIDGVEVKINTDFRFSIKFEQLFNDESLDDQEIFTRALEIYYPNIPLNINQAIEQMIWFYSCGKEESKKKKVNSSKEDIYNFDYDGDKIYSAFLDQYGVDLQEMNLHWWKFKAMFNSLKEDNEISKIMSIRAIDLNKITDKNMKDHYTKIKKLYGIPRSKEEVKHTKNLAAILKRGGDLSELQE
ncbi:bacteriophage Gp15 family protein [Clostridium beijerinckii]|uniref:bacteriophage Gp15 family protein n=1 Tax=Clostridium beijerinckii TaxID=1520 RepID=UPI002225F671|nr:bacteriophage Gp15 family protein [Clostridium beijerinckii]UYZ36799.1 bacteriophage Gp15 family protein [Clostridium beijerinckii]